MQLPAMLTFNELNGAEVKEILHNRFLQVVDGVPYFQHHLTLPRVKMTLQVKLEVWADQPAPETINIGNTLTIVLDEPKLVDTITAESVDTAAPIPGGQPPDRIREMHGLPISKPARTRAEIGGQIVIADEPTPTLDGQEVEAMPGLKVSRTGSGSIDGMSTSANATIAKIDQGPAGLRQGQMNRDAWHFGRK